MSPRPQEEETEDCISYGRPAPTTPRADEAPTQNELEEAGSKVVDFGAVNEHRSDAGMNGRLFGASTQPTNEGQDTVEHAGPRAA